MVSNHFRNIVCIAVGLICAVSYGQELPDLIGKLEKLEGNGPFHGVVHIEDRTSNTKNQAPQKCDKADLQITAKANTLALTVSGKISNRSVLKGFSLLRASELVNYGPALARELAGMKLVERLPDSYQGVACTKWRLKSQEKKSKLGISATRRQDVELWIDPNGYPMAASFKMRSESRVFLMKAKYESAHEQRYKRLGGRLILVFDRRDETARQGKSKSDKRVITTTVEGKKD
jgi:hypothetical protein